MNSELKKPNSFKLLEEEHDAEFFRIPPMIPNQNFFAMRGQQSQGHIIEAKILRSIRNIQSTGNMFDTFFSGMVNTAIGMTGGSNTSGRRKPPPDMDMTGASR
jgi:hypothetical protein